MYDDQSAPLLEFTRLSIGALRERCQPHVNEQRPVDRTGEEEEWAAVEGTGGCGCEGRGGGDWGWADAIALL